MSVLIRVVFALAAMIAGSVSLFSLALGLLSKNQSGMIMLVALFCGIVSMLEGKSDIKAR